MLTRLAPIRQWVTSPPETAIWKNQTPVSPGANQAALVKVLIWHPKVFEARWSRESQQLSSHFHYGLIRHRLQGQPETSCQQVRLVHAKFQQGISMILKFDWLEPANPDKNVLPWPAPLLPPLTKQRTYFSICGWHLFRPHPQVKHPFSQRWTKLCKGEKSIFPTHIVWKTLVFPSKCLWKHNFSHTRPWENWIFAKVTNFLQRWKVCEYTPNTWKPTNGTKTCVIHCSGSKKWFVM